MDPLSLLWLFFILASLQPALARQALLLQRRRALNDISKQRGATVITLIHRQETMSLLGFPLVRFIDIDDAESVLRAIRETPQGRPIEIILHTPGGMVIAARQIASALADHDAQVTAVVPHYAMSGGTLIALACDEIVLESHAALGPVDPQINQLPAASYVEVARMPGDRDDRTLLMADVSRKAIAQVEGFTARLLERRIGPERAAEVAAPAGHGHVDARPPAPAARAPDARAARQRRRRRSRARADDAVSAAARTHSRRRVRAGAGRRPGCRRDGAHRRSSKG